MPDIDHTTETNILVCKTNVLKPACGLYKIWLAVCTAYACAW